MRLEGALLLANDLGVAVPGTTERGAVGDGALNTNCTIGSGYATLTTYPRTPPTLLGRRQPPDPPHREHREVGR